MNQKERHLNLKKLVLSAMLVAISELLLAFGNLVDALDLSAICFSSLIVLFAMLCLEGKYPYLVYAGTGLLGFLFCPNLLIPILYLSFGGLYPLVCFKINKIPSRFLSYLVKFVYGNVIFLLGYYLTIYVFMLEEVDGRIWYEIVLLVLANVALFLYDLLLKRATYFYLRHLDEKMRKLLR